MYSSVLNMTLHLSCMTEQCQCLQDTVQGYGLQNQSCRFLLLKQGKCYPLLPRCLLLRQGQWYPKSDLPLLPAYSLWRCQYTFLPTSKCRKSEDPDRRVVPTDRRSVVLRYYPRLYNAMLLSKLLVLRFLLKQHFLLLYSFLNIF